MMRIYDGQGNDIVRATLGTTLNYDKVLPCLPLDNKNDGSICLEWMHRFVHICSNSVMPSGKNIISFYRGYISFECLTNFEGG